MDRLKDERGTLNILELATGAAIAALVLVGAIFGLLLLARAQARTESRAEAQVQLRNRVELLARDLRRATSVTADTARSNTIRIRQCVDFRSCATQRTVTWICVPAWSACVRAPSDGEQVTVARDLKLDQPAFTLYREDTASGALTFSPASPNLVHVELAQLQDANEGPVTAASTKSAPPITVTQDVHLRNPILGFAG